MASPIAFNGLASGLDSDAIIQALSQAAKRPMQQLQMQKSDFSAQSRKLTDIRTKLNTLQTAAKALDTRAETLGNSVKSSDEKVLKASGTGGASMGSFKVTVSSVAQAQRTYSNTFASRDAEGVAGLGDLGIKVGDADEIFVSVDASDTLDSIASKINASGAAVSAGVFYDGSEYRLQVTGREMGESNSVAFTESGSLALGLNDPANIKQTAKDTVLEVDGIEVRAKSTTVAGVLPGVTLSVVDEGTSVIQIDRDPDALKGKLNTFVNAFNDVMKTLNTEFSYVGVQKGRDSLIGDSTLQSLQGAMRRALSTATDNGSSALTTFGSIGLVVQRDGTLMLDDAKYKKAVDTDYEGVASALAGQTDMSGLMTKLVEAVDPYAKTDGALRTRIDSLSNRNRRIDSQLASMQLRLDKQEDTLRRKYAMLEQTIGGLQAQGNSLMGILSSF